MEEQTTVNVCKKKGENRGKYITRTFVQFEHRKNIVELRTPFRGSNNN